MVRRKGEINSRQIDEGWPYQVALAANLTTGRKHDEVRDFCKDLSLAPRGHTFVRGAEYINVWCFEDEEDAQKFIGQFGGEMLDPEDRPRWPGKPRRRAKQSQRR